MPYSPAGHQARTHGGGRVRPSQFRHYCRSWFQWARSHTQTIAKLCCAAAPLHEAPGQMRSNSLRRLRAFSSRHDDGDDDSDGASDDGAPNALFPPRDDRGDHWLFARLLLPLVRRLPPLAPRWPLHPQSFGLFRRPTLQMPRQTSRNPLSFALVRRIPWWRNR